MTEPDRPASGFRRVSTWWRALAILLLMVLLIGWAASASMVEQLKAQITDMRGRLAEVPQVRQLAVLLDEQQRPAMLVTHDPKQGALLVQRLNEVREGREDSMQLWAIAGDAAPRSLGVVESKYPTFQMTVPADALEDATEIGVSAENRGGVSAGSGPSLPWLFKGWWIRKSV